MSSSAAEVTGVVASVAAGVAAGVVAGAVARERTMPLLPAFAELVLGGVLQRGSTVGCVGPAALSLAMAVAAGPSQHGAWVGVAGVGAAGAPSFSVAAAVELGVVAERLVLVAEPVAGFAEAQWADVLAAMIDGFDVILMGAGARQVRQTTARRLQSRLQSRGAVLVVVGGHRSFGCDLQFTADRPVWEGLGQGHGLATARRVQVELSGRRVARARRVEMWLPASAGDMVPGATPLAPLAPLASGRGHRGSPLMRCPVPAS
ncbi:MAG: hypothetical protein ABIQ39_11545 [Ilumatobacteraceae bacterium]